MLKASIAFLLYSQSDANSLLSFFYLTWPLSIFYFTSHHFSPTSRSFGHTILLTVSLTHWASTLLSKRPPWSTHKVLFSILSQFLFIILPCFFHNFVIWSYVICLFTFINLILSEVSFLKTIKLLIMVYSVSLFQGSVIDHDYVSILSANSNA